MPREIELKLSPMLTAKGMAQAQLAKRVGVSKATIAAYCANRWTVLDRTVLERIADVLRCDAESLLATKESQFFHSYHDHSGMHPTCTFLRRPDAEKLVTGRRLGHRDYLASGHVAKLLEDCVEHMVIIEDSANTPEEFNERIRQDCVVFGSPMVNAASEMAICRAFGVEPFQDGQSGKLPFHFRVGSQPAKLSPSSIILPSPDGKRGIWVRDEKELLEMEVWARDEFRRRDIKKGRDCAVIVVLNHKTAAQLGHRQLTVLSGFGGVGTEGAAMALVDHYRDLDPRGSEGPVWGAIEVFYRKSPDSTSRDILGYNWRYRRGGRCPMAFTFKKS